MRRQIVPIVLFASISMTSCSDVSEHEEEPDGKSDQVGACQVIDMSGGADGLGQLNDPVANLILKGEGCPTTFEAIQEKLQQVDAADSCNGPVGRGNFYHVVSERSQKLGRPDESRVVVSRRCGGRPNQHLLISLFGVTPDRLPSTAELIGFDQTSGVFNYYSIEDLDTQGPKWRFFGNSVDMLIKGPDAATASAGQLQNRRCANCHVSGGLVMKELASPWLHWEGAMTTPGITEPHPEGGETFPLGMKFPILGTHSDGRAFESFVVSGNRGWIATRIELTKAALQPDDPQSSIRFLEPLFCTVEINLDTAGRKERGNHGEIIGDRRMTQLGGSFFSEVGGGNVSQLDPALYQALLAEHDHKFIDSQSPAKEPVRNAQGQVVRDGHFEFIYPARSDIDARYVGELLSRGVIDLELRQDVLFIDFTRPVYSENRCNILKQFPPALTPADATASGIVAALKISLAKAPPGSPAAELLGRLNTPDNFNKDQTALKLFSQKCQQRAASNQRAFLADMMRIAAARRNLARDPSQRTGQIIEFPETLPVSDLDQGAGPKLRLGPTTCEVEED
jgi:hypothetical protein